jgi:hypothetical protein
MMDLSTLNLTELEYDEVGVSMMARMFRNVNEIAEIFAKDPEDVEEEFGDLIRRHATLARADIVKRQWEMARQGNIEILKFLGTKYCSQE